MAKEVRQLARYQVRPESLDRCLAAIREFVAYVRTNEKGTLRYDVWQETEDPTKFVHLFIFADAAAQARHGESDAVKRFEAIYSPELAGGDVIFTDYEMIAGKGEPQQRAA